MNSPFIPKSEVNLMIINGEVEDSHVVKFRKKGIHIIKTIPHPSLDINIAYHPDMVMCPIDDNKLVIEPLVFDYYKDCLKSYNMEVIRGEKHLLGKYPHDVAYNAMLNGGYGFHLLKSTDKKILCAENSQKIEWVDVKQGYSKCSVMIVDDNSIITSDKSIANKWQELDKAVLLIREGSIHLPGYNYGFIGGATGNFSNNTVIITGDLTNHPDYSKIRKFLEHRHIDLISLGYDKIYDVGTILSFSCSH